ncbi:MAG: protein TolR [Planktomarina sp.]
MGAGIKQSGSKARRRRRSVPMSEINVTPFVDVMLVLLIVFMVSAPLMTVGIPVELPKTQATALASESEEPLTVTVTADGKILIQTTEVAPEDFLTRMRGIGETRSSEKVFLRADGSIAYDRVVQIMGAMNAAGFADIGLVSDMGGPFMQQGGQ